jgi:hypothetical protein
VPPQTDVVTRIRRIGYLDPGSPGSRPGELESFRDQLRELGYVEGETVAIEYRYTEGAVSRLGEFAEELAALDLEAIVAFGTQSIEATHGAKPSQLPVEKPRRFRLVVPQTLAVGESRA